MGDEFDEGLELQFPTSPVPPIPSGPQQAQTPAQSGTVPNATLHQCARTDDDTTARALLGKPGSDVNVKDADGLTPLHYAARYDNFNIAELLLDHSADIDATDRDGQTPLHKAARYDRSQIVDLLVERSADLEARDRKDYTPLLLAAVFGHSLTIDILIGKGADITAVNRNKKSAVYLAAEENQLKSLEALLENEGGETMVNVGDRFENTPLHIAAINGHLAVVVCLLKNDADIDRKNKEEQTPLHLAAKHGHIPIVKELVKQDSDTVKVTDCNLDTPLHTAAKFGQERVCEELIKMDADIEARNKSSQTPLVCAVAAGWVKTTEALLRAEAADLTPALHIAATNGHAEVVQLLVEWGAAVDARDASGDNSLDMAIDNYHKEAASVIIASEHWREALMNHTGRPDKPETPMRKLIRNMPDVAKEAFNRCTTTNNEHVESDNFEVIFDYQFLDDLYNVRNWGPQTNGAVTATSTAAATSPSPSSPSGNTPVQQAEPYTKDTGIIKDNHPLMIMVTSEREELLEHPLVTALLRRKWRGFARTLYYANFLIYVIFLAFLTGYVAETPAPYTVDVSGIAGDASKCEKFATTGASQHAFPLVAQVFIIVLSVLSLLLEILQIYQARLNYPSWENLIEWIIYIASLLFVINIDDCQSETGYRHVWQWNLGTIAIFLAWIELVLFLKKFPRFGIYVLMFNDILSTFMQFCLVFVLFIIAFAMGFFTLLQNQDPFATIWDSMMKTSIMMIGEFEYEGIFIDNTVHFEWITYIIFIFFLVVMTIIIMNLLVGLAVDNIAEVQKKAALSKLALQVDLALDVERVMPDVLRKRFVQEPEKYRPNDDSSEILLRKLYRRSFLSRVFDSGYSRLSATMISNALHPELDEHEQVQENLRGIQATIARMKAHTKAMEHQNRKMESMLKAIIEHQEVPWQEEDFTEAY